MNTSNAPFALFLHLALGLLALTALPSSAAQTPSAPTPQTSTAHTWTTVTIPAARQLDVRSRQGHAYRLFVAVPDMPAPPQGFPVLYVLDGNAAFPVAAFIARSLASRREVTGQLPPVVVGIGYPGDDDFHVQARRRDYTPKLPGPAPQPMDGAGGAPQFLDFIEQEVKPLIAANYPIDRQHQALFGHSFGGLFVLYALFTRPDSFATFIASSPSIWWQEQALLAGLPALLHSSARPRLQISVGSLEDQPPRGNYSAEMLAMIASRSMLPPARQLTARLQANPDWAGRVVLLELAGEDHGLAWLPALGRGMEFFLDHTEPSRKPATPALTH